MHGGGVDVMAGATTITDSIVSGNSLNSGFVDDTTRVSRLSGAGLSAESGALTIVDSTIDANSIYVALPIERTYGAGLFFAGSNAEISGTTISYNYSMGRSAGIHDQGAMMTIANTTIAGNIAHARTGGVYAVGTLQIRNSTIAFNVSGTECGGLATAAATLLQSAIVAKNEGAGLVDVREVGAGSIDGDHNLVGSADGATLPADTIIADPNLQALADNGGPTKTAALSSGSPAIDAGSNPLALAFDQRGAGFPRVNGAAADIGAYESSAAASDTIFSNGFEP